MEHERSARLVAVVFVGVVASCVHGYTVRDGPLLTKRPPWLKFCKQSDPQLNSCLNTIIDNLFPELAKGIPEMNVDPFEPLLLDKVSVSKGSGPVVLAGSLFNLTVVGPSNATPTYTDLDIANNHWNFGLDLPLLDIKSLYDLKGKVLILPLVGHGFCELKLKDVKTQVTTDISWPIKDGRKIVRVDKMNVQFTVGGLYVKLANLFNGNKVLGNTVNNFLNQHALEVVKELEDGIGMSLAEIFTDLVNNVYSKMPTDLWLLSDEEYEKALKEQKAEEAKKEETKEVMVIES